MSTLLPVAEHSGCMTQPSRIRLGTGHPVLAVARTRYTIGMDTIADMLLAGGKSNSLGRVPEVIDRVLADPSRLAELYDGMFLDDAWARMRAADAFEKICRQHPEWIVPFIDRFPAELAPSTQPSIRWHLAQLYAQLPLTPHQKAFAAQWLQAVLAEPGLDWIVAANAMDTLVQFTRDGTVPSATTAALLRIQQQHHSPAVVRRAAKHLAGLAPPDVEEG